MPPERLFGTDGVRGRANEGALTPESVLHIGRAIGEVARRRKIRACALIGHDGRRSAGMIGDALGAGLMAAGFDLTELGLITTPGLAFLTRNTNSGLGVMISASHNPSEDNGIKVFGPGGEKLPDRLEDEIESVLLRNLSSPSHEVGQVQKLSSEKDKYLHFLAKKASPGLSLRRARIVLDCANGAASEIGPALFLSLGAQLISLADHPDGDNINRGCGALHPEKMARRAAREKALLGIALDGDGDRAIFSDERGRILDGDAVLSVLGKDLAQRGRLEKNTVVATVMSNLGLRKAFSKEGIKLEIVGVGDRRVVEALRRGGFSLGGEQSGHIVFGKDHHYIGDGLYTALRLLKVIQDSGKALSQLAADFRRFPQVLRNVRVAAKPPLERQPKILSAVRKAEGLLGDSGRVLLRYSGTEPLARVMVEGPELRFISRLAEEIAEVIQQELS